MSGASRVIVLNLGIIKILLFFPTLFDQYKKCPFELKEISTDKNIRGNNNIIINKKDVEKSKKRFIFIYKS